MVQDSWYEGHEYARFMRLTDSGTFTLDNAQIAVSDYLQGLGGDGAVELSDFHGQVAFLNTYFTQSGALVTGDGSDTDLLLLGCTGYRNADTPWLVNQSPNATVKRFFTELSVTGSGASSHAQPDVGDADPVFVRKMLSQVRSETPRRPTPLPPQVTDVRLFRVAVNPCRIGIKLTGTNAAPQLLPMPAEFVVTEGTALILTNQVTDPDLPYDSFTFTLGAGAPPGMNLNPTNGVLTWRPTDAQGPSTNRVQIIIGDDGSPRLFVTNAITITVLESNLPPTLGIAGIVPDDSLQFREYEDPGTSRTPSQWTPVGPGAIDATVVGFGFRFGYGYDSGWFGYQVVAGDFDMRVRVESLGRWRQHPGWLAGPRGVGQHFQSDLELLGLPCWDQLLRL